MSYNNAANGALPSIYSVDLVEEMRKYNAGLTPAGAKKSRPGRGGAPTRGVNRGMGSGISPGRGGSTASRSSNGAGYGMMGGYVVQPSASTATPQSHLRSFAANARAPAASSRQLPSDNRWSTATLSSNQRSADNKSVPSAPFTAFTSSHHTNGSLGRSSSLDAVATQVASATSTHQTNSTWGSSVSTPQTIDHPWGITSSVRGGLNPTQPDALAAQTPPAPAFAFNNHQENHHQHATKVLSSSSRSLIVTNWGPDPEGPFIPSHLKQSSAYVTIETMAHMIGKPLEELTSNGVSIPASRPQAESKQTFILPPVQTEAQNSGHSVGFQANVDPNEWIAQRSAANSARQDSAQSTLDMNMNMDMELDMDIGAATSLTSTEPLGSITNLQTLHNSGPAISKWNLPAKKTSPYVATLAGVSDAQASFATNPLETFEQPRRVATLQDSRWAPATIGLPTHTTSNSQPIQTGWSVIQPSNAAPARPHGVANLQNSQWAAPSFGFPTYAGASYDSFQNGLSYNQSPASFPGSSQVTAPSRPIPTASMAPTEKTATPSDTNVTTHSMKHEPGVKYLKDSMWA